MIHAQRNEKILNAIANETKRALVSKSTAKAALISEGIYTKKGALRAAFREKSAKAAAPIGFDDAQDIGALHGHGA